MSNNPLLQPLELVPYADISLEHLQPAISQIIADNHKALDIIVSQSLVPTWDDLVLAEDELDARLDEAFNALVTLSQLPQAPEWFAAFEKCYSEVEDYKAGTLQNQALYDAYTALANSGPAQLYSSARKHVLRKKLSAFRSAGIGLSEPVKMQLVDLNKRIGDLEATFNSNVRNANLAWEKLITDETLLAGISSPLKHKLALKALATEREGWLLTLDEEAIYSAVMGECENRALREELWIAYNTRASDQGPTAGQNDNSVVLEQLLTLRHQRAKLLGYDNHAHFSLETKAARSTDEVLGFIKKRAAHKKADFQALAQSLQTDAQSLGYNNLSAWDYAYLARRASAELSGTPDSEFSAYCSYNQILKSLVQLVSGLFGIQILKVENFSTWHPDVQLYAINDGQERLGHLYIDPYMRQPKMDGCWTQAITDRHINAEGSVKLPVAILHGNFSPPQGATPSLLEPLQLNMLFHEFGHCLQHILTRSPYRTLSGINFLGRDASEFAGRVLEQWCWSREVLQWMTRHHQTDKPLSIEQVDRILEARKITETLRDADELTRSLFDFELHRTQGDGRSVQDVWASAQQALQVLPWPELARFGHAFDYMTTGYDAGYYVYEWSRPLAEQVFTRFEQEGVFNAQTGKVFREAYYTLGAEQTLPEFYKTFMGQAPNDD